jgi:carotenoid cleavage dioxygenase-like enzyme
MHDFAITEHYSLFLDFPFIFKPERIMKTENGRRGKPFIFDTVRSCFHLIFGQHFSSRAVFKRGGGES